MDRTRKRGGMDEPAIQIEWRRWLAEQAPKFLLFARQKARSEADAQDLVQEALLESSRRNGTSGPPAPALVFATIQRRAIDQARRDDRRTRRELAVGGEPGTNLWFDPSAEQRERAQLIQDAMQQLPPLYREVITLKIWGELSFAEIAQTLGIPANTAASRYRYGLAELRRRTKTVLT